MRIWGEYYILKMDIAKYFDNIDKGILLGIIKRKIKDKKLLWLIQEILYAQPRIKGEKIGNVREKYIEIGNLYRKN